MTLWTAISKPVPRTSRISAGITEARGPGPGLNLSIARIDRWKYRDSIEVQSIPGQDPGFSG